MGLATTSTRRVRCGDGDDIERHRSAAGVTDPRRLLISDAALRGRQRQAGCLHAQGWRAEIWGTQDQFQFIYERVAGDVEIVARVGTIRNSICGLSQVS